MMPPEDPPPAEGLPVWLFVGLPAPETAQSRAERIDLADLTAELIAALAPAVVVVPLIGNGFDAIEACQRLARIGFPGDVVVRAPTLPDRRLVLRELGQAGRGLKITLTGPES